MFAGNLNADEPCCPGSNVIGVEKEFDAIFAQMEIVVCDKYVAHYQYTQAVLQHLDVLALVFGAKLLADELLNVVFFAHVEGLCCGYVLPVLAVKVVPLFVIRAMGATFVCGDVNLVAKDVVGIVCHGIALGRKGVFKGEIRGIRRVGIKHCDFIDVVLYDTVAILCHGFV